MKNYDTWGIGLFATSLPEVDALPFNQKIKTEFYKENLETIQKKFGSDVVWFTLKNLPAKRSHFDHACLLIFQREDGTFWAKRHNNCQFFRLKY